MGRWFFAISKPLLVACYIRTRSGATYQSIACKSLYYSPTPGLRSMGAGIDLLAVVKIFVDVETKVEEVVDHFIDQFLGMGVAVLN